MARVNITMPEDLYARARQAGLNVSQLARRAVAEELEREAKRMELDAYLAELDAQLGPVSETDRREAAAWADSIFGRSHTRHTA